MYNNYMNFIKENRTPIKRLAFMSPLVISLLCGLIMATPIIVPDLVRSLGLFFQIIMWLALIVWIIVTGLGGLLGGYLCFAEIIKRHNLSVNFFQFSMSLLYLLISFYLISFILFGV